MSGDGSGPSVVPEGWYPDPADSARKRWWDGTRWTNDVDPPLQPVSTFGSGVPLTRGAAVSDPFAASRTIATATKETGIAYTRSVWWICAEPLWGIVPQVVVVGVLKSLISLSTFTLVGALLLYNLLIWGVLILLAAADRRGLRDGGNRTMAPATWMLLSPLAYLIARGMEVNRYEVGGWAPVIWWCVAMILTPGVAFLAYFGALGLVTP